MSLYGKIAHICAHSLGDKEDLIAQCHELCG